MKRFVCAFVAVLATTMMTISCGTPSLTCSYRSADISTTPDEHVVLAGFAARQGLSDGVHIPLRTSALAIRDAGKTVCIVSNDLMEISPSLADALRDSISRRSGLARENILMHCIHTHSAPRTGGSSAQPGGTNYNYKVRTFETIISNAVAAITDDAAYRAFRIETLRAQTSLNRNRCEKTGPVDRDVYAVRFLQKRGGKPICAIINVACHPVCLSHQSLVLSSDYSGVARRKLADAWGCEVFQLTGAAGNLDPLHLSADLANVDSLGTALADSILLHTFTRVKDSGIFKFGTNVAHLPFRIAKVTPEAVKAHADSLVSASTAFPRFSSDVRGWEEQILQRFETGSVGNTLDFHMSAINLDGVLFFFTQGEPFCEYQMAARAAFPASSLLFAGYTGGQNSYLPSAYAYERRKGYEYEIEQMHVYIKAPYPLSERMPATYENAVIETINKVQ